MLTGMPSPGTLLPSVGALHVSCSCPSPHPSAASAAASLHPRWLWRHGPLVPMVMDTGLSAFWKTVCHLLSHLIKTLRQVR